MKVSSSLMYPRGSKYPRGAMAPIPSSSSDAAREVVVLAYKTGRILVRTTHEHLVPSPQNNMLHNDMFRRIDESSRVNEVYSNFGSSSNPATIPFPIHNNQKHTCWAGANAAAEPSMAARRVSFIILVIQLYYSM